MVFFSKKQKNSLLCLLCDGALRRTQLFWTFTQCKAKGAPSHKHENFAPSFVVYSGGHLIQHIFLLLIVRCFKKWNARSGRCSIFQNTLQIFFFLYFSQYLFRVLQEQNKKLEQLLMLGKACSLRLYPTPQHTNHKVHLLTSLLNIPRALGGRSGKDPLTI